MKKVITGAFALSALFAAFVGKTHADVNYPWCIIGNTRAVDCYFSRREQCAQDGRNRGFGGQCIQNPYYKPGRPPTVSGSRAAPQTARPSQAAAPPRRQTTRPSQAVSATRAPFGTTIAGPQQRECKTVYVGGPAAEVCNGWYGLPCGPAWRVECSR
jgi:hypothetical protein